MRPIHAPPLVVVLLALALATGCSAARERPEPTATVTQAGTLPPWNVSVAWSACALDPSSHLYCWGNDSVGQLGTGSTTDGANPALIGASEVWLSVATSSVGSSYAVRSDGTLWSWGDNTWGALGLGTQGGAPMLTPQQVGASTAWRHVVAGQSFACGIQWDGTLWCWGYNGYGQLGVGPGSIAVPTPTKVGGGPWRTVSAGSASTCAVTTSGALFWLFFESRGGRSGGLTSGQGRRDAEGEEAANAIVGADGIGGHESQFA